MPTTNYLWDPDDDVIIAEYDEDNNLIASYEHEPGYHGRPISMHRGGHTYIFHTDGMGNVITLTDESGNETDRFAYNAFGEVTERTGTTANPFQWQVANGYYRDDETGTFDVRRRIYSPTLARWLSTDPLGILHDILSGSIQLYVYAANNPINFTDPSGQFREQQGCGDQDQPKIPLDAPGCADVCADARKNKLTPATVYGAVICFKDKDGKANWCPCVMYPHGKTLTAEWDECPEIAQCILEHEVGHLGDDPKKYCDPKKGVSLPIVTAESAKADAAYHEKQRLKDLKCLNEASGKIAKRDKGGKCHMIISDFIISFSDETPEGI